MKTLKNKNSLLVEFRYIPVGTQCKICKHHTLKHIVLFLCILDSNNKKEIGQKMSFILL